MKKHRRVNPRQFAVRRRQLRVELLENRRLLAADLLLSNNYVHEKLPVDSLVGQLTTNDPTGTLPYTFELIAGSGDEDNASFAIDSDALKTAESFDDEVQAEYSVRIRATDAVGVITESVFVIDVLDTDGEYFDVLGTDGNDFFSAQYIGNGTNEWLVRRGSTVLVNGPLASESTQLRFLGSSGTDTLTITGTSGADTFAVDDQATEVNDFTIIGQSLESRRIFASGGSDTLTGPDTDSLWTIDDLRDGTLNTSTLFYDVESLVGGSADDTFRFTGNRFDYISGTLDTGDGWDTLDYSQYSDTVFVSWSGNRATGVGSSASNGVAGTVTNFESVVGSGALNQTVEGPDAANEWIIDGVNSGSLNAGQYRFTDIANVQGGPQQDTFRVESGAAFINRISGSNIDIIVLADRASPIDVNILNRTIPGILGSFYAGEFLIEGDDDNVLVGSTGSLSVDLNTDGSATANSVLYSSGFAQFIGGSGTESIRAPEVASDWFITGLDTGYVVFDGKRFDFSGAENLFGSDLADSFTIENGGSWSGRLYGNDGDDSFRLLGGGVADGMFAGGGSDTLIGPNANSIWTIYDLNRGTLNTATLFYDVESLVGGSADDTFQFTGSRFDYISGTLDTGDGWDTLDYSQYSDTVFVSWSGNRSTGVGSSAFNGVAGTATNFESVVGSGALNQTVEGPDAVNEWIIDGVNTGSLNAGQYSFTDIATVQGGPQQDSFRVESGAALLNRISGSSSDTIVLADRANAIEVNILNRTIPGILGSFFAGEFLIEGDDNNVLAGGSSSLSIELNADGTVSANSVLYSSGFGQFAGTERTESLNAPLDVAGDWFISGDGAGYVLFGGQRFDFSGVDNAYGSNLDDNFTIESGGSWNGRLYGNSGNDSFNLFHGQVAGAIFAGSGVDTLTGPDTNSLWTIDDLRDGTLNTSTLFYDVESLAGGSADDTFQFTGNRFDYISGTLDTGDGWDTLDYSQYSDTVFVSWSGNRATGVGSSASNGVAGAATNFEAVVGSGTNNQTVEGPDAVNEWIIDGVNTGSLNAGQYSFTDIATVQGGPQQDSFRVESGAALLNRISGSSSDTIVLADRANAVEVNILNRTIPGILGSFFAGEFLIEGDDDNVLAGGSSSLSIELNADGTVSANNVLYSSGFGQFAGTERTESLNAPLDVAGDWFISGDGAGYVLFGGQRFDFSGVDNAYGSNLDDNFTLENGGSWNGRLFGNSGNDSFNLFHGQVAGEIFAGSGVDTLTGPDTNSLWTIYDLNRGTLNSTTLFYDVESLAGGSADDTFQFTGNRFDYISGTLDTGDGRDTLDYSQYSDTVFVSWSGDRATGVGGIGFDGVAGTVTNFESVQGSGASNQEVEGPDAINEWIIDGENTGTLNAGQYRFTDIAEVQGGPQQDTFRIQSDGSYAGSLIGNGGIDRLELEDRGSLFDVSVNDRSIPGVLDSYSVENIIALPPADGRLLGSSANTNWQVTADGDILVNSITYFGFGAILGGSGDDTLLVDYSGDNLDEALNIAFDGGPGGNDGLGFTGGNFSSVVYDPAQGLLQLDDVTFNLSPGNLINLLSPAIQDLAISIDQNDVVNNPITTSISAGNSTDTLITFSESLGGILVRNVSGRLGLTGDALDADTFHLAEVGSSLAADVIVDGLGGFDTLSVDGTFSLRSNADLKVITEQISIADDSTVRTQGNGQILLYADELTFSATSTIESANSVGIAPVTSDREIELGNANANALNLPSALLSRIQTPKLTLGGDDLPDGGSFMGDISVAADITWAAPTNLVLETTADIILQGSLDTSGGVLSLQAGTVQVGLAPTSLIAGELSFAPGSDLQFTIDGLTATNEYSQLNVTGAIDLTNMGLVLVGQHPANPSESFLLINKLDAGAITGNFSGLPEGAVIENILGSQFAGQVSYVGSSGNDFVLSVTEPPNRPPEANAAGPYAVSEGGSVQLNASGSTDPDLPDDTLTYQWDLDGDGLFGEFGVDAERGDELGVNPTLDASALNGPSSVTVWLQVTDLEGATHTAAATVNVQNVSPSISFSSNSLSAQRGVALSLDGSFVDPGADDWTATVNYADGTGDQALNLVGNTFQLNHTYNAAGIYSAIVTIDDGDGGVSTKSVNIDVGLPPLPDLAIISSDVLFDPINPGVGDPVNFVIDIRNEGSLTAIGVPVAVEVFDPETETFLEIGRDIVASVIAGSEAQFSLTWDGNKGQPPLPNEDAYLLVRVIADPDGILEETDETNNSAIQVLQVGSPDFGSATLVGNVSPRTTTRGTYLPVGGQAFYDFDTIPGSNDFPVQNASVTARLIDPATGDVLRVSGSRTAINGNFSNFLRAPEIDGVYTLRFEVNEGTLSAVFETTLTVAGEPSTPPPSSRRPAGPGYVFSPSVQFAQPALPPGNPQIGVPVTIIGSFDYELDKPLLDVPVTFNDLFPVAGQLRTFEIGSGSVSFPDGGLVDPALLDMEWVPTAEGYHIIQVIAEPDFNFRARTHATRLLLVGDLDTTSLNVEYQASISSGGSSRGNGEGEVNGSTSSQSPSPGDTLLFTLTYENTGNTTITGGSLVDDFDEALVGMPTNISNGGIVDGNAIRWELGDIAPGASGFVTYEVTIKSGAEFPPGSTYLFNTAILNADQSVAADTNEVVISNSAPIITQLDVDDISSDDRNVTLEVTFSDASLTDSHMVFVDWGDGNTETLSVSNGERTFTIDHDYSFDPPILGDRYEIRVQVTDSSLQTIEGSVFARLTSQISTSVNASALSVFEGQLAANSGTFSGAATNEVVFTTSLGTVTKSGENSGTWSWIADQATTADDAAHVVTISSSDGVASSEIMFNLIVLNVPVSFEAGADIVLVSSDQGVFSRVGISFTDPGADVWSGTVDYGDGTGEQPLVIDPIAKTFNLHYQYLSEGTFTVTIRIKDDDSNFVTDTLGVTVQLNRPPVARDDLLSISEDSAAVDITGVLNDGGFGLLGNDEDPDGDVVTISSIDDSTITSGSLQLISGAVLFDPQGAFEELASGEIETQSFSYTIVDTSGESSTATATLQIVAVNDAPTVSVDYAMITIDEGNTATNQGSFNDVDANDTLTIEASIGHVVDSGNGNWAWSWATSDGPTESTQIAITVFDGQVATSETFTLVVENQPPEFLSIATNATSLESPSPVRTVDLLGIFQDAGIVDTHTVQVDWGDGSPSEFIAVNQAARSFSASHTYPSGGYFTITATIEDKDGAKVTAETAAAIRGIGLVDDLMWVIGSSESDKIEVDREWRYDGSGPWWKFENWFEVLEVDAQFGGDHLRTEFPKTSVMSISIISLDGDDQIDIRGGVDRPVYIESGAGRDNIEVDSGQATVFAGPGRDKVKTSDGDDFVDGGAGDDDIETGDGHDSVIDMAGDNQVETGDGDDSVTLGPGRDRVKLGKGDDVAYLGAGDDRAEGDDGHDLIFGQAGDDRIDGDQGNDIVVGGDGDDRIDGDRGTDLLIGGLGVDRIRGGNDDDLLIAGWTVYDNQRSLLQVILTEWSSDQDYSIRVANLRNGTGDHLDGVNLTAGATVFDDQSRDNLDGDAGRDWFFASLEDRLKKKKKDEFFDLL